jgi:hypothetical protein
MKYPQHSNARADSRPTVLLDQNLAMAIEDFSAGTETK